jgi:hypothetical protein
MLKRRAMGFLPVTLLAFAIGCASDGIEVSTTFDPLTRFPAQATFAWDAAANELPADERIAALDIGPRLEAAAEAEFAAKGYHPATSADPDYLLSYQLVVHSWIGADNSRSVASLSLLLEEAASGRRVWLGFGRAEIHMQLPQDEREARLRTAVAKILEGFPPGAGAR